MKKLVMMCLLVSASAFAGERPVCKAPVDFAESGIFMQDCKWKSGATEIFECPLIFNDDKMHRDYPHCRSIYRKEAAVRPSNCDTNPTILCVTEEMKAMASQPSGEEVAQCSSKDGEAENYSQPKPRAPLSSVALAE